MSDIIMSEMCHNIASWMSLNIDLWISHNTVSGMSCAVSKWVSLCVLLEVLGVVEVAVVMAPLQSTSPVRRVRN